MAIASLDQIDAVLFDMDGTLILSEDRTDRAVAALLKAHGLPIDAVALTSFHGVTWAASSAALCQQWPILQTIDVAAELQRHFHASLVGDPPPPVAGARAALTAAAAVVKTAIVTSSNIETLRLVCKQLDVTAALSATVGAEDCAHSKPSPEPYLLAAERLGVDPRRCLVFEDSVAGVQAARKAGAQVIAIGAQSGHHPWINDYLQLPPNLFVRTT